MADIVYDNRRILSVTQLREVAGGNFGNAVPQNFNLDPDRIRNKIQRSQELMRERNAKRAEDLRFQREAEELAKMQAIDFARKTRSEQVANEAADSNFRESGYENPNPIDPTYSGNTGPSGSSAGQDMTSSAFNTAASSFSSDTVPASARDSFFQQNLNKKSDSRDSRLEGMSSPGFISGEIGVSAESERTRIKEENRYVRELAALEETYGPPIVLDETNPDGSAKVEWGSNGKNYLGMKPGELSYQQLVRPKDDAPWSKWLDYGRKLDSQISVPKYTEFGEESPNAVLNRMTRPELIKFQNRALKGGLYDSTHTLSLGIRSGGDTEAMTELMTGANWSGGGTWENVLQDVIQAQQLAIEAAGGGGGSGGDGVSMNTQVNYSVTSMSEARALLTSVLRNALGRSPSEEELAEFIAEINTAEGNNPTTTTTRTTTTGRNSRSVVRSDPSTVEVAEMAQDFAERIDPELFAKNEEEGFLQGYLSSLGA
tara:strand:- start:1167 stop:2624 length:1458 start_codon:yes stop_codon:yes gene_type:complete